MSDRTALLYELAELFRLQSKAWAHQWTRLNPSGLTITEASMLAVLEREGPMQPSNLANALLITTGGVTGVADKLAERGLIQRSRDDRDRRVVYLEITAAGRAEHETLQKRREQQLGEALSVLSDAEVETLVYLYRKLVQGVTHTES